MVTKNQKTDSITVLIIGLGQIGASIGLDLIKSSRFKQVNGYDIDPITCQKAKATRVVDLVCPDLEAGIANANFIIIATPIKKVFEIIDTLESFDFDWSEKLIIDIAGTKEAITRKALDSTFANSYWSCHPMGGREGFGIDSARTGLFEMKSFIVIPPSQQIQWQIELLDEFIDIIKADKLIADSSEHDRVIAKTSHLPHLLALSLLKIGTSDKNKPLFKALAAGSFKSATRVASSSDELITDMFFTNRQYLIDSIEELTSILNMISAYLKSDDTARFAEFLKVAKSFDPEKNN